MAQPKGPNIAGWVGVAAASAALAVSVGRFIARTSQPPREAAGGAGLREGMRTPGPPPPIELHKPRPDVRNMVLNEPDSAVLDWLSELSASGPAPAGKVQPLPSGHAADGSAGAEEEPPRRWRASAKSRPMQPLGLPADGAQAASAARFQPAAPAGGGVAGQPAAAGAASASAAERRTFQGASSRSLSPERAEGTARSRESFALPRVLTTPVGDGVAFTGRNPVALPAEPPPPQAADLDRAGLAGPDVDPRFGAETTGANPPPKLYRVGVEGSGTWSQARPLEPTLADVKARLKSGGSYRVQIQNETAWGQWQSGAAALDHVDWRLRTRHVGDVLDVDTRDRSGKPGSDILVRIVRQDSKAPKPDDVSAVTGGPVKPAKTPGNDAVDLLHAAAWKAFPDLESWGICNCRHIAGSSSWSQHSWCNAEDLHRDIKGLGYKRSMDPVAEWLHANRSRYGIENIVWRRDPKCDEPTYDHCDHIHVDMVPNRKGTPPCAR
ncbi:MAG: hypothetical protein NTX64_16135 [Elusimicrobia bacterium]|nr:hypothetical protein [Elusimicrobiota bacterium]